MCACLVLLPLPDLVAIVSLSVCACACVRVRVCRLRLRVYAGTRSAFLCHARHSVDPSQHLVDGAVNLSGVPSPQTLVRYAALAYHASPPIAVPHCPQIRPS